MKYRAYVIFFLLFGVLPDLYLTLRYAPDMALLWKLVLCLPTCAELVFLVLIGLGVQYTASLRLFSYLMFLFCLPKAVFCLFSPLSTPVAAVLGAGVALFFAYLIFYSTRHLKLQQQELHFPSLPKAFDGLRICQLTDLHLGSFGSRAKYIQRIVETTLAQQPDLILFTGDLVNFDSAEALPYKEQLARLTAPLGVFAIRGNHDYLLHGHFKGEEREKDMKRLLAFEQSLGWHVLQDEHILLQKGGEQIALAGVGNISANPYFTKQGGDLNKALEGLPDGIFTILMSHDPSHWRAQVLDHKNISLTLSGHTHGLKFKPAGVHLSHWRLHESEGIYRAAHQVLHVSEGLGSAFSFRLSGFPAIDILTLKNN